MSLHMLAGTCALILVYHYIVHPVLLNSTSQMFAHGNKDLNVFRWSYSPCTDKRQTTLTNAHTLSVSSNLILDRYIQMLEI